MNDPRVDGTVTFAFSVDAYGVGGVRVGDDDGREQGRLLGGPCTGGAWAEGDGIAWSCWLTGSGAYDGYTYYKQSLKEVSDEFARGSSGSSTRATLPRIADHDRLIAARTERPRRVCPRGRSDVVAVEQGAYARATHAATVVERGRGRGR